VIFEVISIKQVADFQGEPAIGEDGTVLPLCSEGFSEEA
jgi:hypothetical protein